MLTSLSNKKFILLIGLILINVYILSVIIDAKGREFAKIHFLNVGQGDAIFIESASGNQMLIDGGPDRSVLRELSKVMPFFDRTIDVVVETHPDRDHIGGLPEVIKRYKISIFLEPGVESENSIDDELKNRIKNKKINGLLARKGMIVNLGDGSFLEILFPDRDVSGLDTNDASIVAKYVYKETCFLLTGDSPSKIEEYLINTSVDDLHCQVLKAGHHGSRTSTSESFLKAVKPRWVAVSSGKDNSYGHPHAEVRERISKIGANILRTDEYGTISFLTDGQNVILK